MRIQIALMISWVISIPGNPLGLVKRAPVPPANSTQTSRKRPITPRESHVPGSARLDIVQQHLTPDRVEFWTDFENQIRSGANWNEVGLPQKQISFRQPEGNSIELMSKIQGGILSGSDYLTATVKGIQDSQSTFTTILERLVSVGVDWRKSLNYPPLSVLAKDVPMEVLQQHADLLKEGLTAVETTAVVFLQGDLVEPNQPKASAPTKEPEPQAKKQKVEVPSSTQTAGVLRQDLVKKQISSDYLGFWTVLEKQIRTGRTWNFLLLQYNRSPISKNVSGLTIAFMDKVQSEILAGSDFLTAILKCMQASPPNYVNILHNQIKADADWKKSLEKPPLSIIATKVSVETLQKNADLLIAGLTASETRAVLFIKDTATKMSQVLHLNIMNLHLDTTTASLWKNVEQKIKSGGTWRQVIDEASNKDKSGELAKVMDTIEYSIKIGAPSSSALSKYFESQADTLSLALKDAIQKGQDWKKILKKPEHQAAANKVSMDYLQEQANLISDGLFWSEAKAVLFMKQAQPISQSSRAKPQTAGKM